MFNIFEIRILRLFVICCLGFVIFAYVIVPTAVEAGTIINRPLAIGLTAGLVGHWTFDGNDMVGGQTARDISGQGNNGTLTNGPKPVKGRIGQALEFDGVNDFVNLGSNVSFVQNIGGFTSSVWVKWNALGTLVDIYGISINNGGTPSNTSRAFMSKQTNNTLRCGGRALDTESDTVTTNNAVVAGRWYHVACVIDYANDSITIYLDGVQEGTTGAVSFTNTSTDNTSSASAAIGSQDTGDSGFTNGLFDDFRIYNRALNQDEIKRLYNMGR